MLLNAKRNINLNGCVCVHKANWHTLSSETRNDDGENGSFVGWTFFKDLRNFTKRFVAPLINTPCPAVCLAALLTPQGYSGLRLINVEGKAFSLHLFSSDKNNKKHSPLLIYPFLSSHYYFSSFPSNISLQIYVCITLPNHVSAAPWSFDVGVQVLDPNNIIMMRYF